MKSKNLNLVIATSFLSLGLALKLRGMEKKKRTWVRQWMQDYATSGPYETVYREWRKSDPDMYRTMLQMYPEDFGELLRAVDPIICKQDTILRNAIHSEKRLAITLKYLVTGK